MISIDVTVAGSAGSATGNKTESVPEGILHGIAIGYVTQPATCDVTVTLVGPGGGEMVLFTRSNSGTNLALQGIVNDPLDEAAAAVTTLPMHPPVAGQVRVNVAQGDPGTVTVHLIIEDIEPF